MRFDISFQYVLVYLLVWVRFAGMVLFNPLLSRNNVPAMVRMGLVTFLTFVVAPTLTGTVADTVYSMTTFGFVFAVAREIAVGLVFGYVFQIYYYLLFFVGDMIDTDIGLSMAKTFDPGTDIQTAFSSSIVTMLFTLYVFASGSHLALIRMFADTFEAIPVGTLQLGVGVFSFVLRVFTQVFALALRLVAPFMLGELVLQVCMGLLMKFIPQITVFVINFQLRIILGLLMLFAFAPIVGNFIDRYIDTLFNDLVQATTALSRMV